MVGINVLASQRSPNGIRGVRIPVQIWHERRPDIGFEIAFVEGDLAGIGGMGTAAGWQGALLAVELSGAQPSGVRFYMRTKEGFDGPSAGGLTTVGMIAALRGDQLRADAAMTGTINPDGTIGPVGGIPYKIDGAAEAGMKLVLIPHGVRNEIDENLGGPVDLFLRGQEKGLEVRAVGDIYEAYRLLTGQELPRAKPAAAPELSVDVYKKVQIVLESPALRFRKHLEAYRAVPEQYRSDYAEAQIASAQEGVKGLVKLLEEGQAPTALFNTSSAAHRAGVAAAISQVIQVDNEQGRDEAIAFAAGGAGVDDKLRSAAKLLSDHQPKTFGELATTIYAYRAFAQALCYRDLGVQLINGKLELMLDVETENEAEAQLEQLLTGVGYLQLAASSCHDLEDAIRVAESIGGKELPPGLPLTEAADFLWRAAASNLNQFERSVIDSDAKALGISYRRMQNIFVVRDEAYMIAFRGVRVGGGQLATFFTGEQLKYAELGLAVQTYVLSSQLMAKFYSLGAEYDEDENFTGFRHTASLGYMLDFAKDQTRRNIQLLRQNDIDPSDVVYNYKVASNLQSGDAAEKFEALNWLWEANLVARTVARLAEVGATEQLTDDGR